MSAEQNRVLFRRVIDEVFNQGNLETIRELFHPDFIEHQFGLHATIEGMQEDVRSLRTSFPDLQLVVEEILSEGDKVWVRSIAQGTNRGGIMGPPNGERFRITVFDECMFEEGKVVEHWGSPDRFAMLAQLGLLPQPESR
jgi:predicted ester cyclase